MTEHPITADRRAAFQASLERWQDELNLRDWRIRLIEKPAKKTVMAEVDIDLEARVAKVAVSTHWKAEPTDQEIDQTALHELLHIMLKPLMDAARGKNEILTGSIEHSVINTLERLLGKP